MYPKARRKWHCFFRDSFSPHTSSSEVGNPEGHSFSMHRCRQECACQSRNAFQGHCIAVEVFSEEIDSSSIGCTGWIVVQNQFTAALCSITPYYWRLFVVQGLHLVEVCGMVVSAGLEPCLAARLVFGTRGCSIQARSSGQIGLLLSDSPCSNAEEKFVAPFNHTWSISQR